MTYKIEYFENGKKTGSAPHAGPLELTKQIAPDGLKRHRADFARVIDVDGSGAEVWSIRND